MPRLLITKYSLFFAVWTLLGITFGGQLYAGYVLTGGEIKILTALTIGLIDSYIWALLSLPIIRINNKFPWRGERWKQVSLIHFGSCFVFCILQTWLQANIQTLIVRNLMGYGSFNASELFYYLLAKKTHLNIFTYLAIVLVAYAWQYYREQSVREAQLKEQLTQAQLTALKMQLHPHFLFNTLHSVSALIYKDARAADRMVARLSELLRLTLSEYDRQEVSLKKELEILQKYLAIEQIRFQDRLQVEVKVNPICYDALLPSFLLQPIIENAIRHGIEKHKGIGRIEFSAAAEADKLLLRVRNNGQNVIHPAEFKEGVGLSNTRARLERLYGSDFSLKLQNLDSYGVEVTITVPLRFEDRETEEEIEFTAVAETEQILS